MEGIQLIKDAFALKKTERIPWVPFVGCHGGYLLNKNATEYLKDETLIFEGVAKAVELYKPDGIPVMFDLQIEAEALGCQLNWSDENPPAVVSHPLSEIPLDDLKILDINQGRISTVIKATENIRQQHPDIALYGLVTGPFTLGMHLMGTDLFLKMFEDPEYVNRVIQFSKDVGKQMSQWYIEAGCDIIALVDPMTSQIDPDSFNMTVAEPATEIFNTIRSLGALSSFFVCGDAMQNIEAMVKCKPDNISIDENIPLEMVKDQCLSNNISFGGNMKLTSALLLGDEIDAQKEALYCMDKGGNQGFILAPGCDLPMKTPPKNLQAIGDLIRNPYQQDVIRTIEDKEEEISPVDLKDHFSNDQVIIDVITLDSSSCAPCQYMVDLVKNVSKEYDERVRWNEFSIKKHEGLQMMQGLGVKNVPSIVVDGELLFGSKTPTKKQLKDVIDQHLKKINE